MKKIEDAIEELIDQNSLSAVKEALANVCFEKAEHIQSNWQDSDLAKTWENAGRKIGNVDTDSL